MSTKKKRDDDDEDGEGARSFTRALEMVSDGDLVREASNALRDLLLVMQHEAKETSADAKGELVLKLKIEVEPSGIATITPDIKVKEPVPKRAKGHLWLTKGGNLTPHNPRQQKLPLREVGGEERETREVEDKREMREV